MCGKESKRIMFFSGIAEHDNEGRVITAEFKEFYLVASCEQSYTNVHRQMLTNTRAITTAIITTVLYSCTVQCTAVMSTMTTTSTTTAFPHSLAKSLLLLLIFLHLKGNLLKVNVTVCIPFILFQMCPMQGVVFQGKYSLKKNKKGSRVITSTSGRQPA